jgi:anti-sigma regulatory factor (Ser/Thr protein kinase)
MADVTVTFSPGQPTAQESSSWPLSSLLVLGALPLAVGCARLHTRNVMYEWHLGTVAETIELVVSEFTTNAVLASTYPDGRPRYEDGSGLPALYLRLSSDRVRVLVEVWDANPHAPSPRAAGPGEESGRGLMLVEALCERWSWYTPRGLSGKVVWAEMRAG